MLSLDFVAIWTKTRQRVRVYCALNVTWRCVRDDKLLIRRLVAQRKVSFGRFGAYPCRTGAGIICICCNIALCVSKGIVGLLTGSVSLVADAVNNVSDASSNIVSLLAFAWRHVLPTRAIRMGMDALST